MSNTPLESFLITLGYKVDESSQRRFNHGMEQAHKLFSGLAKSAATVGVAVASAVDRMGRKLDELYFTSKRTGASANNIRALGVAVSQLGGSADDAQNSLEAVAKLLRSAPGSEGILTSIGVQTRDANGNLRDMVDIFKDLSKAFQAMEYYKANAFAEALGIDERTLMAMRSGEFVKRIDEQRARMKALGLDMEQAAETGRQYAQSYRDIQTAWEDAATVLATRLLPGMKVASAELIKNANIWQRTIKNWAGWTDFGQKLVEGLPGYAFGGGVKLTPDAARRGRSASGVIVDEQGRPVGAGGKPAASFDPSKLFANLEAMFGLPAGILDRMWNQESGRGKNMLSPAGAQGHFQFMPGTAKQYGLKDPNDLNASATAAARYLHDLLAMFGGDINKAVAAYNWGPGKVQQYGLGAMPAETRGYVKNVAGGVQVTQQTSIVVQGSADPYATGQAVANQQNRVAQDAIRNFAPLVR